MVGKLVKNEMRATKRLFLSVFAMTLIGAIITLGVTIRSRQIYFRTYGSNLDQTLMLLSAFVIYGLIVATVVLWIRASITILYGSIYKQNAYRVFTTPISSGQLLLTKVLTMLIWSLLFGVFAILTYGLAFVIGFGSFGDVFNVLIIVVPQVIGKLFGNSPVVFSLFIVMFFLSFATQSLLILFAGSIANSSYIRKNRGIMTFLLVLGISMISSWIGQLFVQGNAFALLEGQPLYYLADTLIMLLHQLILMIICSAGTIWFWNRKLEVFD